MVEVIEKHYEIVSKIPLSEPTSFAPMTDEAINVVAEKMQYHILIIITNRDKNKPSGMVSKIYETTKSILHAFNCSFNSCLLLEIVFDMKWNKMMGIR